MSIKNVIQNDLQDIEKKMRAYEELNEKFKNKWADFEEKYYSEINELDRLREERNVKLDEMKRALRAHAENTDSRQPTEVGEFKVIKKWSKFYNPEKLVQMLKARGMYITAVEDGIVVERVEISKYERVKAFLEKYGMEKEFECCEDGSDAGVAVFGPKPIPTLGAELPKE